jgi:hypothetical protein
LFIVAAIEPLAGLAPYGDVDGTVPYDGGADPALLDAVAPNGVDGGGLAERSALPFASFDMPDMDGDAAGVGVNVLGKAVDGGEAA